MGNVCCGEKDEKSKKPAFVSGESEHEDGLASSHARSASDHPDASISPSGAGPAGEDTEEALREKREYLAAEAERQRALREEQARLELIVSTAGRDMVPVGRRDGGPMSGAAGGYYDPAYAAAAAQEIHSSGALGTVGDEVMATLAKCDLNGRVPSSAIPAGDASALMEALGCGRWEGIELGTRGGLGGCGGEDPEIFFDDLAEGYLDRVVPTRETLFRGVGSIVENLP
mmetsp:Transcript_50737/g.152808  ORF Transcript_50737/g.152808 Transcript_50737/m.152808 type:complete len:229 (-) Transcript_50737:354-1040(-)|eukprot:CAMPEP_0113549214 /NCGR_PEP_ID=MMETSP0015_2-20120614/13313_1 /TAXON_ID=2838 /ORGANISM="Odontella" /LENGTH=228 /DNA_ID=CAMNT_0000449907 /DNA_START=123 /DNA_END=809 /DNA_ORIENTATION=- /assembly_acc=CAM_ASM_000160